MITYCTDTAPNTKVQVRQFTFPGGEIGVDINFSGDFHSENLVKKIWVDARLQNANDVMALVMTVDALKRAYPMVQYMGLYMPYVPYARQDRVCNPGESLSIAAFAKLINSLGFDLVNILDPHSPVTSALLDNCFAEDQYSVFHDIYDSFREVYIVAPDAGATKKCEEFAKRVGAAGVITCSKTRELSTGKITGLSCEADVTGLKLLVLDDICDGGRTFIELAQLFGSKPKVLDLAVTHGIFSKGFEVVGAHYNHVYTTDSFGPILDGPTLTVIHVE